jgi:hypothetical protein
MKAVKNRVTIRVSDALCGHLADRVEREGTGISEVVRRALEVYLDGRTGPSQRVPPDHGGDACAEAVLQRCHPYIRERMTLMQRRTQRPTMDLLVEVLHEDFTDR